MFKYYTFESFLSEEECSKLINYSLNKLKLEKAKTSGNDDARKSQIVFNDYRIDFPKIIERLENQIINTIKVKGYEVNFTEKRYQFTEYKVGDFYNWHTDSNPNNQNKDRYCSVVIQLTDNYEGGNLELLDDDKILTFKSGKGNLFIFLSNQLHRVTTLKTGIRYSLVMWFSLKPIKNYNKSLI